MAGVLIININTGVKFAPNVKKSIFVFILKVQMVLLGLSGYCQELDVRHIKPESQVDQRNHYYLELLSLALEKTKSLDGEFQLIESSVAMPQGRALKELEKNSSLDVVWSMSTIEREEKLLPIRIPLLKGLLGYRVFIVRNEDHDKFKNIESLEQLKLLVAGQGHDWPDTRILKANDLPVVTSPSYDGLFDMLNNLRFDYFPRGIQEPWAEVASHSGMNIVVEKTIMLKYRAPIYFFVNVKNIELADRLERGLRLAINDGSFNELFYSNPINQSIFKSGSMNGRRIFELENPLLSAKTPLDDEVLWFNDSELKN